MQDVIAHLRVSSGVPRPTENKLDKKLPPLARAWTPLYVSLIPLMVTALGGDMQVELEAGYARARAPACELRPL